MEGNRRRLHAGYWWKAYQLAIYNPGRGFEHGTTVKQIQAVREEDLNPGPPDYKSSALTTRPRRLPFKTNQVSVVAYTALLQFSLEAPW